MKQELADREKECFDFLNLLPSDKKYVVVGGYAVSSYGLSRFSVDLDIVIPGDELSYFKKLIDKRGFVLDKQKVDLEYEGKFERYNKGLVSVDLLINTIQSRQTGYSYPFDYVFKNSKMREVIGWDPTVKARIRVPMKEMLIALKIHSMRSADKRDIIMLCYEKPDDLRVWRHLENCPKIKIQKNINELLSVLDDQHFKDSLKGVFSISDVVFEKSIGNCLSLLKKLKK
jgi:hypothetical protein